MQSFLTDSLWLSNPGHDQVGFLPPGLWGNQDSGTTYTLTNSEVTYTFERTANGLSLRSWQRAGSSVVWENSVRALWRVTVFDVLLGKELGVSVLEPVDKKQEWIEYTADGISASWQVNAVADRLRVVIDMSLSGDMLLTNARLEWLGTPTRYAVDAVCVLPMRVQFREIGSDVACLGAIKGMSVRDPRYRFRYCPEDTAQPAFGWLAQAKNLGVSSAGKSLALPVWGYYAETDLEGWMAWTDERADEIHSGVFQSDGQRLVWEYWIPMPNWIQAGNSSSDLTVGTKYGLRPFLASSTNGWWDVADWYRQRLEVNRPSWYVPKTQLDPDRHPIERRAAIWCDFDIATFSGDISEEITGAADLLRTQLGVGTEVPMWGYVVGEPDNSRPHFPASPPRPGNSERLGVSLAAGSPVTGVKNTFFGLHKPANHLPGALDSASWGDGTTNWWEEWDGPGMLAIQRLAVLQGETTSNRGTNGSAEGDFYLEEDHVIASYNSSLKQITTVGTPGPFDRFFSWGGTGCQFISPTYGVCTGEVDDIVGKVVTIKTAGFIDKLGIEREPVAGMAIKLADLEDDLCNHAIMGSEVADFIKEYLIRAQRDGWRQSLFYMDVLPSKSLRNKMLCSGTHSLWNRLLPGYVAHPSGGGSWWIDSMRRYFRMWYETMRTHQTPGVAWLGCEYLDEVYFPYTNIGLHTAGYGKLWRTFDPSKRIGAALNPTYNDPDDHGIRPVPMFAVVHAGRGFGMQRVFSFGNGALSIISRNDAVFPTDAPKFRQALSWWMCGEWVFGMTPLSYTHSANDNLPVDLAGTGTSLATANLWDDDQYTGASPADADIAGIRDLWVSLASAEIKWALSYLRNGQLLPPGDDQGSTTFDMAEAGIFDRTSAALGSIVLSRRNDLSVIWDIHNHPRASHAAWRASTGSAVCVFFLNWTNTSATAHWTFPFSRYGLSGEVVVFRSTAAGTLTRVTSTWTSYTYNRTVDAYTMQALILVPESEVESLSLVSNVSAYAAVPSRKVVYWAAVVTIEVQMLDGGVPVDLSVATSRTIRGLLPGGLTLVLTNPTFVTDGTDGRMYQDLSGDTFRSNPGVWRVQGLAVIGGETLTGSYEQIVAKTA